MDFIAKKIASGANEFLKMEYAYLAFFIIGLFGIIVLTVEESYTSFWTSTAYLVGSLTSIISGYLGMSIAVKTNFRTSFCCKKSLNEGFIVAFRGGAVLGFLLVGLGLLNMMILLVFYIYFYLPENPVTHDYLKMLECLAGYGLGGSTIALFGRVGGGIYTKAADVGADLVGKYE